MMRWMCKSKIHRATVTDARLEYEGSLELDEELLEAGDLLPYEMLQVVNLNNGERFETYVIPGKRGSGVVCLNGAAARLGQPGDRVIVISSAWVDEATARTLKPLIVHVDEKNQPLRSTVTRHRA
ncbi:MAG: aspartate 1-decarboxylase [Elusimicrobia bacterium]|nr:aspartate 1-decarboxylase [Elusimicrobiota bacterium]